MAHRHHIDEALLRLPLTAQQKYAALEVLFAHSVTCANAVRDRLVAVDELVTSIDRRLSRSEVETEEHERLTAERDSARVAYADLTRQRDRHLATKGNARARLKLMHDFIIALANDGIVVRVVAIDAKQMDGETLSRTVKRTRIAIAKATAEMTAAREAWDGLPSAERVRHDAELRARLLDLEHAEEHLIAKAISSGAEVQRRSDVSGWALLGIEQVQVEAMEAAE